VATDVKGTNITISSGNVFQDLGRPDAAEKKAKVKLAVAINDAIAERDLKQRDAAALLHCVQPEVSALANLRLGGFSLGRLMEFLTALDRDVEIGIRKTKGHGTIHVRDLETA
jgi:predicted XRE-type DNA-binding protein